LVSDFKVWFHHRSATLWTVEPREWKAVKEIETGPDRVAIVAAASVEARIADIISHRLKSDESPAQRRLATNFWA
jgi:hypothetical protein